MDLDFLAKLVALDTDSDAKKNYEKCCEIVKRKAEAVGLNVQIYNAPPLGGKHYPNVVIELDAGAEQTLLLAAHYDVVAAGAGWEHQPFKLTIKGDKAYGRGAADDKGGILSALSALETLKEKASSKVNVKLLVTCDEEVGGEQGLGFLMEKKRDGRFLIDGDAAILVDAGPEVYIGSSGRISGKITLRGSLGGLLSFLSAIIDYSKERGRVISKLASTLTKGRIYGRISVTMIEMSAGALEYAKAGVKSNVIPGECRVKLRGRKEILVLGRQGHAGYPHLYENAIEKALKLLRTIPPSNERGKCELVFDLRTTPEEDLDSANSDFKKYVKKINPEAELEIQEKKEGYVLSEAHPFVRMLKSATGEKNAYGEFGGTDAPFFCGRGIPSICFGPISYESNIHGKDEFVKIKDMEFVSNSLVKLCEDWKNL